MVRAAPTVLSRSDWLRGRQRWPRAPWGWWTLEMVMMANPGCPQGNRDPRAEPRPVLLWQGPVQHAAVREAAVKGSLGGGPDAAGGCTWLPDCSLPGTPLVGQRGGSSCHCHTTRQPPTPFLGAPPADGTPSRPASLPGPPASSRLSSLTVLGQLEQTTADRDRNNRNSASWCWRPEAQPATGPRPFPASPSSRRPAPCSVDAAARPQGRQRPISATPRSHGRSVSHPPLPPS